MVSSLLEAVMAKPGAANPYLMNHVVITLVLCPSEAGAAKHALPILTSSYTVWGGLNGTLGGMGGMETWAKKAGDAAWKNAALQAIEQDVFVTPWKSRRSIWTDECSLSATRLLGVNWMGIAQP